MNYPVWYLPEVGGGFLIALIAIFHVFVSHFAVGGGLYLIYSEKKGLAEHNQGILDFTQRHARFFLLATMVFGSISGVGIWFIIALVNPAATSLLTHNFVFGWAAEWVFFMVEIAAAFVYFYMFDKMDSRTHLQVGWLYFFSAWMSLLLINGIIGMMLTPGEWLANRNFWSGFFNPSFLPSLFFRTFVAVLMAGCYGYLSAAFTAEEEVRTAMTRFSGKWSLAALIGAVPAGIWYLSVLPEQAKDLVLGKSPTIAGALQWGGAAVIMLLAISLIVGIARPAYNLKPVALFSMVCALLSIGSFEWTREAARRPYVLNEVMYSNSILKDEVLSLNQKGFLQAALWVQNKEVTAENRRGAGRELYIQQCYACHTLGGLNNDLVELTRNMSYLALNKYIGKIHDVRYFMPPFAGTEEEAGALAAFLAGDLHGKDVSEVLPAGGESRVSGQLLFEETCSACHVPDDLAPALEGEDLAALANILLTLDEISDEMVSFAGTDEELVELGNYLYSLNSEVTAAPGPEGRAVFEDNCSACHEPDDMAEKVAERDRGEIFNILGHLEELVEDMPPFEGSSAERAALADYLDSLRGGQ